MTLTERLVEMARTEADDRYRVERLAQYNAEYSRGIMHTREWAAMMLVEQDWFTRVYTLKMGVSL